MIDLDKIEPSNFIEDEILADLKAGRAKEVITRCPPEPSGYWHIGHCKAWMIDFETAIKFGGYTYLRMDDTNPSREQGEFADSYLADLKWLGYTPKAMIFASEAYFDKIYEIAEQMIMDGYAYVDELSQEEQQNLKGTLTEPGKNSPFRDRPKEESLKLFREMKAGKYPDGSLTLRAKIDMAHPNILMRDPIMYKISHEPHYKTGDKWCIYPIYDFAHPMEDALEGVTYSLCDITFRVHRELYEWFIEHGWKKPYPPKQREFSTLNLENVLLGKRYLKALVNSGKVLGWDDPRFMTIVGMKRRGYTADGVKNFIRSCGVVASESTIPFSSLEHYIRDDLNKVATRAMVVLDPLKVIIENYPEDKTETIEIDNNPNDENAGKHTGLFGREIYIEQEDFALNPPPKYNRLTLGGMVRLKGAYIIKCNDVVYKEDGTIDYLKCEYIEGTKSGQDNSGIKVKGTIHFVAKENAFTCTIRNFKNLVKDEYLWPSKALASGVSIDEILEPNSLVETMALAENFLKEAKPYDKFQFMRKGYYALDKDSTKDNYIFNSTISLKDGFKK
ncbi:MAG: glutamine--tRNA ligase [Eubacteriales bacterium]|nr:glutamine--tRNA ligase [Eubacteriales bacterium]